MRPGRRTRLLLIGIGAFSAMTPLVPLAAQSPDELVLPFLAAVGRGDLRAARALLPPNVLFTRDSRPRTLAGFSADLRGCTRAGAFFTEVENDTIRRVAVDYYCQRRGDRQVSFYVEDGAVVRVGFGEPTHPVYVLPGS